MVELRKVTFENYNKVVLLKTEEYQKEYVEDIATTLALAYAGINEKCPGELCVIYYENEPVGVILVGRSEVAKQEPKALREYKFVYRFMGFFIDYKYQHKGIGKKAFKLALDKVKAYTDGAYLPMALEVKVENANAIKLYESFGFHDSGIRYGDDCAFIRLPQNN